MELEISNSPTFSHNFTGFPTWVMPSPLSTTNPRVPLWRFHWKFSRNSEHFNCRIENHTHRRIVQLYSKNIQKQLSFEFSTSSGKQTQGLSRAMRSFQCAKFYKISQASPASRQHMSWMHITGRPNCGVEDRQRFHFDLLKHHLTPKTASCNRTVQWKSSLPCCIKYTNLQIRDFSLLCQICGGLLSPSKMLHVVSPWTGARIPMPLLSTDVWHKSLSEMVKRSGNVTILAIEEYVCGNDRKHKTLTKFGILTIYLSEKIWHVTNVGDTVNNIHR